MPAYNDSHEFPHKGWLNLTEACELTGYSNVLLRKAIYKKELFAVKRYWWYGLIKRSAWFVKPDDLMRWVGWRSANRGIKALVKSIED